MNSGECKNAKASVSAIAASIAVEFLQYERHCKLFICKNGFELLKMNLIVWLFPL